MPTPDPTWERCKHLWCSPNSHSDQWWIAIPFFWFKVICVVCAILFLWIGCSGGVWMEKIRCRTKRGAKLWDAIAGTHVDAIRLTTKKKMDAHKKAKGGRDEESGLDTPLLGETVVVTDEDDGTDYTYGTSGEHKDSEPAAEVTVAEPVDGQRSRRWRFLPKFMRSGSSRDSRRS